MTRTQPIEVLLVEDDPGDIELTRASLETSKIHVNLSVASDGEEALRRLKARDGGGSSGLPDLILLDLNLPKKSGRELLGDLKSDPHLRRIPVVILTSSGADTDILKSYDLGANAYVTKPIKLKEFHTIVQAIEDFWFAVVRLPGS